MRKWRGLPVNWAAWAVSMALGMLGLFWLDRYGVPWWQQLPIAILFGLSRLCWDDAYGRRR